MAVERTKYGTWRSRWRDPAGRQRSKTFKRKVDADRHQASVTTDLARGVYVAPVRSTLTVRAWAEQWLAGAHNIRKGTRKTYQADLDRYILPAFGDTLLVRLTDEDIDDLIARMVARELAPATVSRAFRTLRRMLNVAVAKRKLVVSPLVEVATPHVPASNMRFLDVDELERAADGADAYRSLVVVAGYGGPRWAESAGLRRANVDRDLGRIHIVEQMIDGQAEEVKSTTGRRWVTLPESVMADLDAHLDATKPGPLDLVWTSPGGEPLDGSNFRDRIWLPACLAAGIAHEEDRTEEGKPPIIRGAPRWHDLRHTAVALAIGAGAHPKAIQMRMGHSSILVTLGTYGHLLPEMDAGIAEGLERLRHPKVDEVDEPHDEAA